MPDKKIDFRNRKISVVGFYSANCSQLLQILIQLNVHEANFDTAELKIFLIAVTEIPFHVAEFSPGPCSVARNEISFSCINCNLSVEV